MPNQPKKLPKKAASKLYVIGIDCRLGGLAHAGIGRYILNLVGRVALLRPQWQWKLLVTSQAQAAELIPNPAAYPNVECIETPYRHYTVAEQWYLPSILSSLKLDLLHVPHFNVPLLYKGKLVVTIHDLLWHEQTGTQVTTLPAWIYWPKYAGYRWVVSQAVRKAQAILVPTQTIKATLAKYYPFATAKTSVTYEGSSLHEAKTPAKLTEATIKQRLTAKKLIYVGSLYPHKNVECIIRALLDLPDYTLTIIGSRSVFAKNIISLVTKLQLSDRVQLTGYLDDTKLAAHLASATALIQPSFSEGFGLTGLEALSGGVPVVASRIPIFQEVYQDGAFFFDPYKPEELAATVKALTPALIKNRCERGLKVAQTYSWDTMATQTVSIYEQHLK